MSTPRPELLALLTTCKRQPDEDAPRLVLADWLEENGDEADSARAQVIRLQLAEAQGLTPPSLTARGLIREYSRTWLGAAARAFGTAPDWLRGLLRAWLTKPSLDSTAIAASEEWAWVERARLANHVPQLDAPLLAAVTELELALDRRISRAKLRALAGDAGLARLRSLTLNWWVFEPEDLAGLLLSPHLAGLVALDIAGRGLGPEGAAVLARADSLAGLRHLGLLGQLWDEGLRDLAGSAVLAGLRSLELNNTEITAAGVTALCGGRFGGLRVLSLLHGPGNVAEALERAAFRETLEELQLRHCPLTSVRLPPLPHLRRLDLSENELRAAALAELAGGPLLGRLESLGLRGNPIGLQGVRALAVAPAGPRALHLEACRLGDRGAKQLARWPGLAAVEWLSLANNEIGLGGVKALCDSPHAERLAALDLDGNPLEEDGVRALLASPLMDRLRWLSLRWTAQLPALADALASRRPEGLRELGLSVGPDGRSTLARLRRLLPACVIE